MRVLENIYDKEFFGICTETAKKSSILREEESEREWTKKLEFILESPWGE